MQVRLLGPVDVVVDGQPRLIPGQRRQLLLAALAISPGDVVGADRLLELVWGDDAPATAANTLQSTVSYLRRALGTRTAILARSAGYVLNLGPDGTDVAVAERLIADAGRAADPAERVRLLRAALALWRGPALADLADPLWLRQETHRLYQLWSRASRLLVEARLSLGEHRELLPELEQLVRDHPLDEGLHGHLMLALYRAERQADSLDIYHRLRGRLSEDLGIDPGPSLRALAGAILRQDPELEPTRAAPATAPPPPLGLVPAQLPLAVPGFVGRRRQVATLDGLLPPDAPATTVIAVVSGAAGVGKTTLAVHWAHRVADRFPDGQLYLNLRGFDPSESALAPAEAIRRLLDAFGIAVDRLPAGLDAQAALYRTVLAGRRVLLLLDNAADVDQVRPLLPGVAGCLAIVTSRDALTALVALDGARPVSLDQLSAAEAEELLGHRLGAGRVAREPEAVAGIVTRCAGLPLALAIVAGRAASQPDFPLAGLAAQLRAPEGALDALDSGVNIRAVFSWSYQRLSSAGARLFRLFGLHRGPDITLPAAASLAGADLKALRGTLAELTQANLVAEPGPGRYAQHDLLRAYAAELAAADDPDHRRQAVGRLFEHYLHTAHAAANLLHRPGGPFTLDPPGPDVVVTPLLDSDQATAWLTNQRPSLLAAVASAAEAGLDAQLEPYAWALRVFLDRHGYWSDDIDVQTTALAAAQRLDSPAAQARARRGLAGGYTRLGRFDDALVELTLALELLEGLDDASSLGRANLDIAHAYAAQGRYADALGYDERALATFASAGLRSAEAMALNDLGWCHAMLGHYELAVEHCREAVARHRESDDRWALAAALDSLGYAQHHLGDRAAAVASYVESLALWRDAGDQFGTAETLAHLAEAHQEAGNAAAAAPAWHEALDILDRLGHPYAGEVRARRPAQRADHDDEQQGHDEREVSGEGESIEDVRGAAAAPEHREVGR